MEFQLLFKDIQNNRAVTNFFVGIDNVCIVLKEDDHLKYYVVGCSDDNINILESNGYHPFCKPDIDKQILSNQNRSVITDDYEYKCEIDSNYVYDDIKLFITNRNNKENFKIPSSDYIKSICSYLEIYDNPKSIHNVIINNFDGDILFLDKESNNISRFHCLDINYFLRHIIKYNGKKCIAVGIINNTYPPYHTTMLVFYKYDCRLNKQIGSFVFKSANPIDFVTMIPFNFCDKNNYKKLLNIIDDHIKHLEPNLINIILSYFD